jgi:hypothetical protein
MQWRIGQSCLLFAITVDIAGNNREANPQDIGRESSPASLPVSCRGSLTTKGASATRIVSSSTLWALTWPSVPRPGNPLLVSIPRHLHHIVRSTNSFRPRDRRRCDRLQGCMKPCEGAPGLCISSQVSWYVHGVSNRHSLRSSLPLCAGCVQWSVTAADGPVHRETGQLKGGHCALLLLHFWNCGRRSAPPLDGNGT